jgi:hypothetical protein
MVLTAQSLSKLAGGTGFPSVEKTGNFDEQFGAAIAADLMGHTTLAAKVMDAALNAAPPGSAGWLVPVETAALRLRQSRRVGVRAARLEGARAA